MKRRIRVLIGGVGLFVIVGCLAVWLMRHHKPAPAAATTLPQPAVATSLVRNGALTERVTAHGRVGPPAGSDAKLVFGGSGVLTAIDVTVGEKVHAGQPLAQYAGAPVLRAQLASARAKVAAAHAKLLSLEHGRGTVQTDRAAAESALRQAREHVALDRATLARQQTLLAAGVTAQKDVQAAQAQLTLDEADVRAAETRVKSTSAGIGDALSQAQADYRAAMSEAAVAQRELQNATLRAPRDGVVIAVLKHVGEAVDPTTPVIDVGPPQTNDVTLTVPGSNGLRIHKGDRVDFTVVGTGTQNVYGHVTAVVPAVDPATQTTTVTVDGAPPSAAPGDAVDASIVTGTTHGIIVPSTALVQDPQTGKTVAFVQIRRRSGGAHFVMRAVRLGPSNDRSAIVRDGLQLGDRVATQGAFDLLFPGG